MARMRHRISELIAGAGLFLRGFGTWATSPGLMALGAVPALIVGSLMLALVIFLGFQVSGWAAAITPFADSWDAQWSGLLRLALAHRLTTLVITLAIFALSIGMLRLLGTEFVPKADFSETTFAFYTPQGSSLEATEAKARRVSRIIRSQPEVVDTLTSINTASAQGKTSASIHVRLKPRSERQRGAEELAGELRQRLLAVPGITLTQSGLMEPVGGQKQIEFSLQGPNQQQLERLAGPLMQRFAQIPGLVDLDSSSKPDKPTVDIVVRQDAASSLGLSSAQIAAPLRTLIAGTTVGNWRAPDDETYDIIARLAPDARRISCGMLPI